MKILSKPEYEEATAATRDARMAWWREARFGMFVHFGLYSVLGRHEWAQSLECIPKEEYAKLADRFQPKEGCAREWAKLAKAAGMKYMVLTTRHHEGFSLWDSKVNPFNAVNYGPHRDIVREFVDACHEYGLKVGFYSSLMDWHNPDGAKCAYDDDARKRFTQYIEALNTELLTQYGKIDVLWYDVACPMESWEGWDSLVRNQHLRALQPDIIINDRSHLDEDFGTPEGSVVAGKRDWEACMTFNDISWGYLDSSLTAPYAYTAPRILRMLHTCASQCGNLLLNIGPAPDGSVPADAVKPLTEVGQWLAKNGEAVYGRRAKFDTHNWSSGGNGITATSMSADHRSVYLWNWIAPPEGEMYLGGYFTKPVSITLLSTGEAVPFTYEEGRIHLTGLKKGAECGVAVYKMQFDRDIVYHGFFRYPQLNGGRENW